MPDPFAELRDPIVPVDPDPAFAAGLRARLERALALPRGVTAVTTTTELASTPAADISTTEPRPAAVPYLAVADARAALDWYTDVFGAHIVGEPIVMPDGRIGHSELAVPDGGVFYLSDEHPEIGVVAPTPGAASVSLMLSVDDADLVRDRAIAAGATGDRPPYDGYGRRNAWIVDPFGHRWGLNSPVPQFVPRPGDVGYVSICAPDANRASAFYADLLGWTYQPGGTDEHHNVEGTIPSAGLNAIADMHTLFCCYAVDDIETAAQRVRDARGEAGEPVTRPFGTVIDCTDDQGTWFALYEEPAERQGPRPPVNGRNPGDLAYLTLEVVDSGRARAFYGAVLGWQFSPGRIADGWQVQDTAPMIGLSGGHERATAVPMWLVADIDRAVAAVRANGGTATDVEQQPYGRTSTAADDQGVRFYLGEM